MPRPRICVIGSLNMDLVVRTPRFARPGETILGGPFATYPGGKGANQAVAAARLGAEVSFVGCVGDDAYGAEFRRVLQSEGIDISHLTTKRDIATGVGMIAIDERGQNSIIVALGANLALTAADIDAAMPLIRAADVVMLQLEIPLETNAHVLHRSGEFKASIMLNAAPAQPVPPELLRSVDILVVNEIEAIAQTTPSHGHMPGDSLIAALPHGNGIVRVLTLAERGCITCEGGDDTEVHPAFEVDTVDTVGAGDCFCGALAVSLAEGADGGGDLAQPIRFASAAAAIAVTRHGAIPSLPSRHEVVQFLLARGRSIGRTCGEAKLPPSE
jgi:ribokinase